MTQHIRERSRKPSTPQVQDGAGTLAKTQDRSIFSNPTPMMYCSLETPTGKNCITL